MGRERVLDWMLWLQLPVDWLEQFISEEEGRSDYHDDAMICIFEEEAQIRISR